MADVKFSQFTNGGDLNTTDEVVGLRAGVNTIFNAPANNALSNVDNQHANAFFAGPASGIATTPTFRTMVVDDLPVGVWYSQGLSAFSDITNGSDTNTFFASVIRPLQTISAAQTYLASAAASARCANFIAPGTYAESGTLSLGANIFVTGSEPQDCTISGAVNINNTTWNVNSDLRAGFINCNLTGSLLFNFTSQTNNAQGKIYLHNCLATNAPVMTAQNTANQLNIKNSTLTGGITAIGGAVTSINSTCNGNINISSSAFANTSYTAKGGTMGGNYSFVSTGGNTITVDLRGIGTSSTTTLSATGNVTIVADYLSLPAQANITLSGGATIQIISSTFFDNAAKSSLDVQNRKLDDSAGNIQLDWGTGVASAVNYVKITNAATTGSPTISATGSDSNISMNLKPKGAGIVQALDGSDSTKILALKATGANASTTTTISATSTANRTLSLPDATDTLAGISAPQTVTNKIMTGATNTLTASLLKSATTEINISGAAAPSIGQVLIATSSTTAAWAAPTYLKSGGQSSSTTPGTVIGSITAAAGTQLANWHLVGNLSITASSGVVVTVTYSDTTTASQTFVVNGGSNVMFIASAAGIFSVGEPTFYTAVDPTKEVTGLSVTTSGTGAGVRQASMSAMQIAA